MLKGVIMWLVNRVKIDLLNENLLAYKSIPLKFCSHSDVVLIYQHYITVTAKLQRYSYSYKLASFR